MIYTKEVQQMCCVAKGANHANAPIPEEGKWVHAKEIKDISGLTHGIGWCAPQQGACKLTLNVKDGIIEEALVETIGCSGMTHSAAMASEILPGKTLLEALNTDLVCDAINTAMRELFLQIVYGRTQSAFSEDGLPVGASLEDLGKNLRSQVGTMFGTKSKGSRYLEMTEGYCTQMALDENDEVIGYEFVNLGKSLWTLSRVALQARRLSRRPREPTAASRTQLSILTHVKSKKTWHFLKATSVVLIRSMPLSTNMESKTSTRPRLSAMRRVSTRTRCARTPRKSVSRMRNGLMS